MPGPRRRQGRPKTPAARARRTGFSASLEVGSDRWCTVWVAELPGLFVNASSERRALQALPEAIGAYLRWLSHQGELGQIPETTRFAIVEGHAVPSPLRWGGYQALHAFERAPVTQEEVIRALRWMGSMRADTVRFIESLPRAALQWTRPGQRRTIKEHLQHIARAERWYLEQLHLGPFPDVTQLGPFPPGPARHPLDRLARVRSLVGWRLLRLTPEECARVVKTGDQRWSIRKMLGRFLYHERYHLRSMARIARYHNAPVPKGLGGWARY